MYQRTIAESVGCVGIGLHSGSKVSLKVRPAPVDNGIVFIRTDLPSSPTIKASVENVVDTTHATTIGRGDARVSTIEHLMASFAGLGIDNAFVEVDAPEVPIMDGSAGPLLFLIKSGGIRIQHTSKRFLVIRKTVRTGDEHGWAELSPAREFKVSCSVDFDHPMLQKQAYKMNFSDTNFEKELSMARTFGFLNDVEYLRSRGLIKGGSLDNAIVIDDFRVLNEGGLRFPDEFVRHKMLDAIGDISILGMPVIGHLSLHKSGHRLNFELAKKVINDSKAWKIVELKKKEKEKVRFKVPQFGMMKPSVS
ncbi:MAG: UDP-3-O-acyl-N-acetylglucosamine deacetylase [Deltaproteobacteria bacterium]|nr:UDP-3-O-acyl-N-acetylglucosamine deacetylase [Deltaproteobacteria bacterium]